MNNINYIVLNKQILYKFQKIKKIQEYLNQINLNMTSIKWINLFKVYKK